MFQEFGVVTIAPIQGASDVVAFYSKNVVRVRLTFLFQSQQILTGTGCLGPTSFWLFWPVILGFSGKRAFHHALPLSLRFFLFMLSFLQPMAIAPELTIITFLFFFISSLILRFNVY